MSRSIPFKNRMALGAYIQSPESYPSSVVIYFNDDFVVIHDKYPKATIHTLLLPRDVRFSLMHPFDALEDVEFLAKVQKEVMKLKVLVATELQRRLGTHSRSDAAREAVLNGTAEPEDVNVNVIAPSPSSPSSSSASPMNEGAGAKVPGLPAGRDWAADVKCGVHAVPSMGHLHIHVLSGDMHSPTLRHRKHYNSFNTPFLVDVADFPLPAGDPRRSSKEEGYMRRDLVCWRCQRNFKNQFKELKEHLDEEFEQWKTV